MLDEGVVDTVDGRSDVSIYAVLRRGIFPEEAGSIVVEVVKYFVDNVGFELVDDVGVGVDSTVVTVVVLWYIDCVDDVSICGGFLVKDGVVVRIVDCVVVVGKRVDVGWCVVVVGSREDVVASDIDFDWDGDGDGL